MYKLQIFNSIKEINPAIWNKITDNQIPRTYEFLLAVEEANINDCQYFYPVIINAMNEIVAHTCVYTITTDLSAVINKNRSLKSFIKIIRTIFPNFLKIKITECGTPVAVGIGHTISIRPHENIPEICQHFSKALDIIAKKKHSKLLVIRDFLFEDRKIFDAFLQNDFEVVESLPTALLDVKWNTIDEYLKSMKSRHRHAINKKLAKAKDIVIEINKNFIAKAHLLSEQVHLVFNDADLKREIITPEFYININKQLPNASFVLTAKENGNELAHVLLLTDNHQTMFAYYGRTKKGKNYIYFKLLNEIIAFAILQKSRIVNFGVSTYEAKKLFGAKMKPLHVYFKHRNSIIRFFLKTLPFFLRK